MRTKHLVWLVIGLVIINLGLVGYIVGQHIGRAHSPPIGSFTAGFDVLLHELPEARRAMLIDREREGVSRRELARGYRRIIQARNEVHKELTKETVDEATLRAALSEFRGMFGIAREWHDERLIGLALALTLEERKLVFGKSVRDRRGPRPRRDGPPS